MVAELAAVRLLAPHFGDSSFVWTNVIGIILAAIAAGAWFGGRLAVRADAAVWPFRLLVMAGLCIAATPFAGRPLGAWLLPADLPLDAAMPAMVRGSFVATAVLFAPPMLLLGAVSPLLVTALVRGQCEVGRAAGGVGAAGTLGSLAGTFAATHWLVPLIGCRWTMAMAGAFCVVAGLCVASGRRTGAAGIASVLLVLATGALHTGPLRAAPSGRELLAERESPIQFLQVHRENDPGPARTMLVINEGLDSFHSLAVAGSSLTGGAYYDWHALAPLFAGEGRRPDGLRALSIGDAAGSLRTVYAGVHPGATVDGVDIDAACGELGDLHFAGPKATGQAFVLDGRVFLEKATATWHVIHVDAYAHQVYVPAHLASREFFAAAKARLAPGGVIACNIGALHGDDPVLRAIGGTVAEVFGHALAMPVPESRNHLLLARNGPPPDPATLRSFAFGGERLGDTDLAQWRHIVDFAGRPGVWFGVQSEGEVLVDDRPVLDRLLLASYVDRQDAGEALVCAGGIDPAGAEIRAFGHAQTKGWQGVLAAVRESRAESTYLRELAGDARWSLRQLKAAAAEYERALRLPADAATSARLEGKLATVREQLVPIELADRVAARNGWLELAAAVAFLVVLGLLRLHR